MAMRGLAQLLGMIFLTSGLYLFGLLLLSWQVYRSRALIGREFLMDRLAIGLQLGAITIYWLVHRNHLPLPGRDLIPVCLILTAACLQMLSGGLYRRWWLCLGGMCYLPWLWVMMVSRSFWF